jgi:hypothetical protein
LEVALGINQKDLQVRVFWLLVAVAVVAEQQTVQSFLEMKRVVAVPVVLSNLSQQLLTKVLIQ